MASKILLVEDDPVLAKSLLFNLESDGYRSSWAQEIAQAQDRLNRETFDVMVLDLQLPDGNGIEFCRNLRLNSVRLPILILTAQSSEDAVVTGLTAGANDYVKKPFSTKELLARIRILAHGTSVGEVVNESSPDQAAFEGVTVQRNEKKIFFGSRSFSLNHVKMDILFYLISNARKIVSRETLLRYLDRESEVFDRTIDAHISQIRKLLKDQGITHIQITSVYGAGYRLETAS